MDLELTREIAKQSPDGGEVRLSAQVDLDGAVIEVSDQGPGLPDDIDVYEPFVRGDSAMPGSGLGLHIAKTLVESLGGRLTAESERGQGTTFAVALLSGVNHAD